jgi:hypothetical protein
MRLEPLRRFGLIYRVATFGRWPFSFDEVIELSRKNERYLREAPILLHGKLFLQRLFNIK